MGVDTDISHGSLRCSEAQRRSAANPDCFVLGLLDIVHLVTLTTAALSYGARANSLREWAVELGIDASTCKFNNYAAAPSKGRSESESNE